MRRRDILKLVPAIPVALSAPEAVAGDGLSQLFTQYDRLKAILHEKMEATDAHYGNGQTPPDEAWDAQYTAGDDMDQCALEICRYRAASPAETRAKVDWLAAYWRDTEPESLEVAALLNSLI